MVSNILGTAFRVWNSPLHVHLILLAMANLQPQALLRKMSAQPLSYSQQISIWQAFHQLLLVASYLHWFTIYYIILHRTSKKIKWVQKKILIQQKRWKSTLESKGYSCNHKRLEKYCRSMRVFRGVYGFPLLGYNPKFFMATFLCRTADLYKSQELIILQNSILHISYILHSGIIIAQLPLSRTHIW